jgi:hypothetical protein
VGILFMVLLKQITDLLDWLERRDYLARLRDNRRAVRRYLRTHHGYPA